MPLILIDAELLKAPNSFVQSQERNKEALIQRRMAASQWARQYAIPSELRGAVCGRCGCVLQGFQDTFFDELPSL